MIDPLSHLPGYALRRASVSMMAAFNARLQPLGLRSTEATVLLLIDANPGISQSILGKVLDIQRANISPLITRLEERALVERKPIDGRSSGLRLSENGQAVTTEVKAIVATHEAALIARLKPEMRPLFAEALRLLWD